jgi:hypothetical protein
MNIYIGNLHYNVNEEELKQIFKEYGEVMSVTIQEGARDLALLKYLMMKRLIKQSII